MRAFAVDTLELSDKFYKAGLLFTKNDLKLVETRIDEKFNTIRQEIKTSMLTAIISLSGVIAIATSFLGWLIKS